nr:hypothetical protein ELOWGMBK_ELOWGMBK_CDS_0009 [Herelleviridae sp.]CAI9751947.1 hypothetical protein QGKEIAJE_QGKEIAJE_CDS_0008 [uncultured phage]
MYLCSLKQKDISTVAKEALVGTKLIFGGYRQK